MFYVFSHAEGAYSARVTVKCLILGLQLNDTPCLNIYNVFAYYSDFMACCYNVNVSC